MRILIKYLAFILFYVFFLDFVSGKEINTNGDKQEFQIHLKSPAKSIRLLMYEKNFVPIQGTLSEDKKSIIIKNYESGSKVRVKVEYEDGSIEEFVRSPCYIDPVVIMNSFFLNSNCNEKYFLV